MNPRPWLFFALLPLALPAHAAGPLKRTFSFDEKSRDALVRVIYSKGQRLDDVPQFP